MSLVKPTRALISVSDKTHLEDLVQTLQKYNISILSTGGTFDRIKSLGAEVVEVAQYTKSPEILDGRVKTLHPKIHGGLLGVRNNSSHQEQMKKNDIENIDIVIVNLYPFEQTVQKDPTFEQAIEQIDIGGPSMLRSAAKNHAFVTALIQPSQYKELSDELDANQGSISLAFRKKCALQVFEKTALYDASIAKYFQRSQSDFPTVFPMGLEEKLPLRYGENPHQRASFTLTSDQLHKSMIDHILQGKTLSYNNLIDMHAAVDLMLDVQKDFTVGIFKHTNPCGVARSTKSLADAYNMALACDRTSAFGGIVIFSHEVDENTAQSCTQIFTEIVVAPGFSEKAKIIFSKKKNIRLLQIDFDQANEQMFGFEIKRVLDGFLIQDRDRSIENIETCKIVTERKPTAAELSAMDLAWRVTKHVKSNAIVLTDDHKTLGIGAGQMSRVDSTKIALSRIQNSKHNVLALGSDAFFPFRDSIDLIAQKGVTCVIQPGGSVRDDEVIEAANEHHISMIFTSVRHFKH
ncbi:MAG: bifunctional phosphoribosylaminoimidazolecarboxamide formyltransferase/IMP cyclohydrolase [Bdellovibrionales bacterium]|nr:bifunctional phosphoribosylaminoimidazolecarboxamide formyltransferase/IMP cyclohydrolase [Bdellovibrionales bacterium]